MNTSYLIVSCSDEINSKFKEKFTERSEKPSGFFEELPSRSRATSKISEVEIAAAKGLPIIYCADDFNSKLYTIVHILKYERYNVNAHILLYDRLYHTNTLSSMYKTVDNVVSIFKTCSCVSVWFYNSKTGNFVRILHKIERTNYYLDKNDIKNSNLNECIEFMCYDLNSNNYTMI